MPRKEATAEELLARARANGYERGAHREKDSIRDANRHVEKTKKNQDRFLRLYAKFMVLQAKEDCLKSGTPIPDEAAFTDTVRESCLGKGAPAPDIETVKDFLRFYIATSRGMLDHRSTVDSVNTYAEWFFAGFTRVTGTPTDKEERSEVFNWVRRTLTKEGVIVNKRKPKHLFGKEDLTEILVTLWTKDDLIFIHERNRVQFTFIFHVYCWTGARLGAFFTGGLRYKDLELVMKRLPGGGWTLIYKIDQRWVKNNRDPDNISFGAAGREHAKLLYNDGALLLAMAIADEALFGFNSMEDLWRQEIPQGEDEVSLRWNESVEDLPILRKATMKDGVTKEPMTKAAFLGIYQSSLKNAGYLCGTSIHAIRRYLGKMVDERYTETERSQHITQSDPRIFGQSYVANCSSVDGQAAFLGEAAQHDHINYFQGLRKFREKGLPNRLPAKIEASLGQDSNLLELKNKVQQLEADENADPCEISTAKSKVREYFRSLKAKTLQQYKQDWVRNRRDWKVTTRGKEPAKDVNRTDFTQSLFLVVPERGRLAKMMASDEPLTEGEMRQAMQDLYSLCVRDYTVLYRPGEEPIDGACPVKCCRLKMESLTKRQRNTHIHECQRRELASTLEQLQSDLHYCYQCFGWFPAEIWDNHCQSHLSSITSKRCGSIIYCNTVISPVYYPFCLGDAKLPASLRWQSWVRDRNSWTHLEAHIEGSHWPSSCPHPLCDLQLNDKESFYFHLSDIHNLCRGQHTKDHNPGQDKGLVNQKRKRQGGVTHNGKRQKVTEGAPQTDIITSSSEASTTLDSWTVKSPSPSSIFTETVTDFKNSTISPNLTLFSPISLSTGGDHNGDNFPSLPEFRTVNDEDQSTGISVVDLTEDKPSTYDNWLSQYTTISSSACSSIKGDSDYDDNKSLFDLTPGKSHPSLEAKAPSIDYSRVKPNKRSGIKLRLNPPKPPTPKILLRVKPSEPRKRCDPVKKNGGGARTPVPTIKKSRRKRCT